MMERSFIYAMLHTRVKGEPLGRFRDEVNRLNSQEKQWFVEQFAREFNIEIVSKPTGFAQVVSVPPAVTFVKGYLDESPDDGSAGLSGADRAEDRGIHDLFGSFASCDRACEAADQA